MTINNSGRFKETLIVALGSGLEYYDFILFGMMANYLSWVFFPTDSAGLGLVKTYAVFSLTYVLRPLGGIVFGHRGDRYGRKSSFNQSIILMGGATLLIACLPSYHSLGGAAAVALLALRAIQALAQGAELPGAITLLCESSQNRQGINTGILIACVGMGAGLASLFAFMLAHWFTKQQIIAYAWRVPFFFGAIVAFIIAYLRKGSAESPLFEAQNCVKSPLLRVLIQYPWQLVKSILLLLPPAVLIVFKVVFPAFFAKYYVLSSQTIYLAMSISLLFASVYQIIIGYFIETIGREKAYFTVGLICLTCFPWLMDFAGHHHFYGVVLGLCFYQFIVSTLIASALPLLANEFDTKVRFTGVALSYNLTYSLAALCPLLVTQASMQGYGARVIYLLLASVSVPGIFVVAGSMLQKIKRQSLGLTSTI